MSQARLVAARAGAGVLLTANSAPSTSATASPARRNSVRAMCLPGSDGCDGPLVVGAVVRSPQDRRVADRAVARAVQGGAGAAVDDLVKTVAHAVEPPLLVVAAVP